jgi:small neutral amino acid transporter SnatA (MarC family)
MTLAPIIGLFLLAAALVFVHSRVKKSPRETNEKWLVALLSLFLLIPAFFWTGHYVLHMRVSEWSLAAGLSVLFLAWVLFPTRE